MQIRSHLPSLHLVLDRKPDLKVAYVHVLPLEYYPPACNALTLFATRPGWDVRVWSSRGNRGDVEWVHPGIDVMRHPYPGGDRGLLARVAGYMGWHLRVASELAGWRPDAILYVEPHSALAVWLYFRLFRGNGKLFIHHHEYYAPADYFRHGTRLLRMTRRLEQSALFPSAVWVSQTNEERLRLLRSDNPGIPELAAQVLPNYPPQRWLRLATTRRTAGSESRIRFVYVGSASVEDTFLVEFGEWVARFPNQASLHVCGNNIHGDAWRRLTALNAPNITCRPEGYTYDDLPTVLRDFDVGLVLYRGNTLNFVFNVPNKTIEYLAAGLEVWYPVEMTGMAIFAAENPELPLREFNFNRLPEQVPDLLPSRRSEAVSAFSAEYALLPLIAALESVPRLQEA